MKISSLKGVGEKTENYFNKLGVYEIDDLLRYFPKDYETFETPGLVKNAMEKNFAVIRGIISAKPSVNRKGNLSIISVFIDDESGMRIKAVWFNAPYIIKQLRIGTPYIFRGRIGQKFSLPTIEQPQIYTPEVYRGLEKTLQPLYPLTKGLTNKMVINAVKQAMFFAEKADEYIPNYILQKNRFMNIKKAIEQVHFPDEKDSYYEARRRLAFEEFFLFILTIKKMNEKKIEKKSHIKIVNSNYTDMLLSNLPFDLTKAQLNAFSEIRKDFNSGNVMSRLIQGDVGSGKTIIAILAMLDAAYTGYQSAFMVPTEVLAVQHFETINELFREHNIDIKVELLTGSMTAKEKRLAYANIENNDVKIIIGTHALIQEKVKYDDLGLVITDEQHRFGVGQREQLQSKGESPHVLVMSATPIPRTLALILYGDLDISVINELPAERLPIKNCVVKKDYRSNAYRFIEKEILKGRQAYIICPMVEYTEGIDAENVVEYADKLQKNISKDIVVKYLHGQMKPSQKNEIMDDFSKGRINVLVSTTVIEVGVNVKNATVMMIEDAQRFGLAALHQLRGRVGRGAEQSFCIMVDTSDSTEKNERLEVLNKSNDGFFIASEDLKSRGPGDILGIRQSGDLRFKVADVYNDSDLLQKASEYVEMYMSGDLEVTENEKNMLEERCRLTKELLML